MSILCALFGLSKQAYNKKIVTDGQKTLTFERAKRSVLDLRRQMPRLGTRKLHYLLEENKIKVGRDRLFDWLRDQGLLIYKKRRYIVTTNSKQTIQHIGAVLCQHNKVNSLTNMVFYWE